MQYFNLNIQLIQKHNEQIIQRRQNKRNSVRNTQHQTTTEHNPDTWQHLSNPVIIASSQVLVISDWYLGNTTDKWTAKKCAPMWFYL